jgi:hypothetical protein
VTLPKFGGKHIGKLDLTDFAFDLKISHPGIEIMFEAILT